MTAFPSRSARDGLQPSGTGPGEVSQGCDSLRGFERWVWRVRPKGLSWGVTFLTQLDFLPRFAGPGMEDLAA